MGSSLVRLDPARAPLVPLALAFGAGIALAPVITPAIGWAAAGSALVAGAGLLWLGRPGLATAGLLLGVAAAGTLRAAEPPLPPDHVARLTLPARAVVEGRLAAEPTPLAPDRMRLLLEVERVQDEPRQGPVLVTLYGEPPPLGPGYRIRGPMRLHRAAGLRNPGGFDHGAWLRRQGIHVTGSARADRLVILDEPPPPWAVRLRRAALDAMRRVLPPVSAALLAGLLLGDRSALPADVDENFRAAGVYHILAVSGFNVALVAGAAFALAGLAGAGRRAAALAAIAGVLAFAGVAGPEPSVLRAVVMAVLVLAAAILEREAAVLNSLALAALGILAARPQDLEDPGFQLSFAATLGIVLAPIPRGLVAGALGVSLAAQAAVLPVALWHFNQLSTLAPLANLVVVPLAAAATVLGLLAVAAGAASTAVGALFLEASWPVLLALRAVAALVAAVPGALLRLPAPPWTAVVAYVLGLALALTWWRWREAAPPRGRRAGVGALVALAAALLLAVWPLLRPPDGRLRLTVLDVGQGDAIALETPDGRAYLVDTGPGGGYRLDAGDRVIAPYLWNRGIRRLAGVFTTHGDLDHAGGLASVLRHFPVARTTPPVTREWIGGAASLLPLTEPEPGRRGNAGALALRLDFGAASFLLASDLDAAAEARLVAAGAPLAATVLKVAHHGSRHSSTAPFLDRVQPALAVISVGARNTYGHPAPETLRRLAEVGARVYRTDRDGAVLFETDGAVLTVTRWATGAVERFCLSPEGCPGSPAVE
jgi:competence protein ComEC